TRCCFHLLLSLAGLVLRNAAACAKASPTVPEAAEPGRPGTGSSPMIARAQTATPSAAQAPDDGGGLPSGLPGSCCPSVCEKPAALARGGGAARWTLGERAAGPRQTGGG